MISLTLLLVLASVLPGVEGSIGSEQAPDASFYAWEETNPFIGSGGLGFGYGSVSPAVSVPHGPLRLGPDTASSLLDTGFQHFSGYFHPDQYVRMFSHTRYVGAGINGLGSFGMMPVRGGVGQLTSSEEGVLASELERDGSNNRGKKRLWWSSYKKETEQAHAGFYSVELEEPEVLAQMLATSRLTGIHSYKFQKSSKGGEAILMLDVLHQSYLADMIIEGGTATLKVAPDGRSFAASFIGKEGYPTYLFAELISEASAPTWTTCTTNSEENELSVIGCQRHSAGSFAYPSQGGKEVGPMLLSAISFGELGAEEELEVQVHVALSFISEEQAKENLKRNEAGELPRFSDELEKTKKVWEDELSFLSFEVLDDEDENDHFSAQLITAAMRSRMTPSIYSEGPDGLYMGFDGAVHNATAERSHYTSGSNEHEGAMGFYSDFSLWDIFRTQLPWTLLTSEPKAVGILRSLAEITKQQGGFPKWTSASVDKHVMIGVPGASLALEASFVEGLSSEFDIAAIQAALQDIATNPSARVNARVDVPFYLEHGYVSSEAAEKATSYTLSYSFDDFVLAGLSSAVGESDAAEAAALRAGNYRNIFVPSRQLMCPKSVNGTISCPEHPERDFDHYTEGNALHWTYFVPHDVEGLIDLFPSPEAFDAGLSEFFNRHLAFQKVYGNLLPNAYFWAGNEPTMLTPWMFDYGRQCEKTQFWTREITHKHFSSEASGIPGNDDYASMSTFLLFSSLGIYPVAGKDYFLLGSPRVKSSRLTIIHANGATSDLRIETHSNSRGNVYVQKLLVNGKEWDSTRVPTSVLKAPDGCVLEFFMSSEPSSSLCPS